MLHDEKRSPKYYEDINKWWNGSGVCIRWHENVAVSGITTPKKWCDTVYVVEGLFGWNIYLLSGYEQHY
jgi:hypothetical protein